MTNLHVFGIVLVVAAVTFSIRAVPFILFSKGAPRFIEYLSKVLPAAVIAMLVVYCLKSTDFIGGSHGLPEIVAIAIVIVLHKWKHNVLLSIICGTLSYMLLVQTFFQGM